MTACFSSPLAYHAQVAGSRTTYVVLLTVVVESNICAYLVAPVLVYGHSDTARCHIETTDGAVDRAVHHLTHEVAHASEVAG